MITVRPSAERGHANHGWLNSKFSFSFADYFDPQHVQFRGLRVINEDHVAPAKGFGMHPHRDMEIITWVRSGKLEHADTMGNKRTIEPNEVQAMSAGSGLMHSEYNPSADTPVHLFQIWIMPEKRGIAPVYDQKTFDPAGRQGKFQVLASSDRREGSLGINADASFLALDLAAGEQAKYPVAAGRGVWVQVASGEIEINGALLKQGDGAAIENETQLAFTGKAPSHVLLFDLA